MTDYILFGCEFLIIIGAILYIRRATQKKAIKAIQFKDFKTYSKLVNGFLFKMVFPPKVKASMDLFAALTEKDDDKIKRAYHVAFGEMRSLKDKKQVCMQILDYAIIQHDIGFAGEILNDIEIIGDSIFTKEAEILFKIYLKNDISFIGSMEEEFNNPSISEPRKFELASLLYIQYNNLGNKDKKVFYASFLKK